MAKIASSTGRRRAWINDWRASSGDKYGGEGLNHLGTWLTGVLRLDSLSVHFYAPRQNVKFAGLPARTSRRLTSDFFVPQVSRGGLCL